jgi:hypothetical protein
MIETVHVFVIARIAAEWFAEVGTPQMHLPHADISMSSFL